MTDQDESALGLVGERLLGRLAQGRPLLDLADAAIRLRDLRQIHYLVVGEALPSDRTNIESELDRHAVVRAVPVPLADLSVHP